MRIKELKEEIACRKVKEPKIRKAIDLYCEAHYSISGFSATGQEIFARQKNFGLCLARQIPTVSIEHLAQVLLACWLTREGIATEAIPMAYTRDCYHGANPLKVSYVKMALLERGKNGPICKNKKIVSKGERGDLDGRILAEIPTLGGQSLPEYHYHLRRKVLGEEGPIIDISPFFLAFLETCFERKREKMPKFVYVAEGKYARRIRSAILDSHILLRPPADWFYLFHLLMYVDGKRALLFTVGDDAEFVRMFQKTIREVKEITGFEPLVIFTPNQVEAQNYRSEHLTEIPCWVLEDSNWQARVSMPASYSTLFAACEHFEKQILDLA